ncbi:hypothetical protein FACS1894147_11000 [Spirochaetia bacterium]|nr:hypothetical protein FACS1894147_11000 [Spirochaetia bacterium]
MDTINYECIACKDDCFIECDCLINDNQKNKTIENLNQIIDFLIDTIQTTNNKDTDYLFILNTLINRARHLIKDIQSPFSQLKKDYIGNY